MRITVDDRALEVEEGRTLLQALDDAGLLMNGVDVPHYCWHPKLSIDGSCRLCQVEVEGQPKLQIACNTPVQDGMVVRTDTERVKRAREGVMELLLVNHPLDCPICDQAGECKLQDYAFDYGLAAARTREPRRALKKNVDLGPTIVFDQERCILCRRCVRFCREIPGTGELGIFDRGDRSVVDTVPGLPLDNAYSMNVADVCPVGWLTTRRFRFKIRTWFLEESEGVCTGCSRGCNLHVGVANNRVQRYVPRRNDAVNDTWICDAGRDSYARIAAADRMTQPHVRDASGVLAPLGFEAAIADAAARLARVLESRGPAVVAGVASAHATNEDLFTFGRLLDALSVSTRCAPVPIGESDDLLIRPEKAANAAGARLLGFGDARAVTQRIRNVAFDALIFLGPDLLDARHLGGTDALAGVDAIVVLDTHRSAWQRAAHVMLPTRHAAEKHGTLTNFAGRVQRVVPVVEPAWEALADGDALLRLGAALGLEGFDEKWDPFAVSRALAATVPAFEGVHLASVGSGGRAIDDADGLLAPGGAR